MFVARNLALCESLGLQSTCKHAAHHLLRNCVYRYLEQLAAQVSMLELGVHTRLEAVPLCMMGCQWEGGASIFVCHTAVRLGGFHVAIATVAFISLGATRAA